MGIQTNSWFTIVAKSLILVLLMYWAYVLVSQDQSWTFLDAATLVFHEAGHLVFFWLGDFISFLGGSLMQLLVPGAIFIYILRRQAYFSAAFGLYWLGSSLVNVGVYIKDARAMTLRLIGGSHDWQYILGRMNMLEQDYLLGGFVEGLGIVIFLTALVWMATDIFINGVRLISGNRE